MIFEASKITLQIIKIDGVTGNVTSWKTNTRYLRWTYKSLTSSVNKDRNGSYSLTLLSNILCP